MVGNYPHVREDYRNIANPHKDRYPDKWEEELEKSATLPPFRPITHIGKYIIDGVTVYTKILPPIHSTPNHNFVKLLISAVLHSRMDCDIKHFYSANLVLDLE